MEIIINNDRILAEIKEIFKYLDRKIYDKIPSEIKELINEYNSNYKFEYDFSKELNEQDITQETKDFIVAIYYFYAADEDGKKVVLENINAYETQLKEEKEKKQIASMENSSENKEETNAQLIVKKEPFFKKLIDKVLSIFRKG